jgi:GNAT superfamily N-acetyltransferase
MVEVRRVGADEWQTLRDVRLRALEDSPDAFATRFDDARPRPEAWWTDWAAASADGDGQAMFLAWEGATAVGIVGTFVGQDGRRWLIAMWTDPGARGRGVGRALVDATAAFARGAAALDWLRARRGRTGVVVWGDGTAEVYRSPCGEARPGRLTQRGAEPGVTAAGGRP